MTAARLCYYQPYYSETHKSPTDSKVTVAELPTFFPRTLHTVSHNIALWSSLQIMMDVEEAHGKSNILQSLVAMFKGLSQPPLAAPFSHRPQYAKHQVQKSSLFPSAIPWHFQNILPNTCKARRIRRTVHFRVHVQSW